VQELAMKLTSQPSSACACERNWSNFDFIHSKRRNKLSARQAADLVHVFSNLRVLRRSGINDAIDLPDWEVASTDGEASD